MSNVHELYTKDNYTIQRSMNIEEKLYAELQEILYKEYHATISELVNYCIERLLLEDKEIYYYKKPDGEIVIYRSIMFRRNNIEALQKIKNSTGISMTRLVNLAIKEFIDEYNKK